MFRIRTTRPWVALALPALAPLLFAVATIQSVSLKSTDVKSGASTTGIVTMSGKSAAPVSVAVISSKPSLASVPPKISVTGQTGTFAISTAPGQAGCTTFSAQVVGTSTSIKSELLFVQPTNSPGPLTLVLFGGNTVLAGGSSSSGVVQVAQLGASGAVQLTSSNPSVTVVPASATLAQAPESPGVFQASFTISAAANAGLTCSIITATFQGSQSRALVKVLLIGG